MEHFDGVDLSYNKNKIFSLFLITPSMSDFVDHFLHEAPIINTLV